jgi:hypothetical protein
MMEVLVKINSIRAFFGLTILLVFSNGAIAAGCYESSIQSPTPFMGNNGEVFKLSDGSIWEVKYEYNPSVIVCADQGKLIIGDKKLNVQALAKGKSSGASSDNSWEIFEETNLVGSISGTVKPGRIFRTTSGSIYEVTGLTLQLVLELQPSVMVLRNGSVYKLVVEGFDEPLICSKLK